MRREVTLSASEKEYLQGILKKGRHAARKIKRSRILLLLSEGVSTEEIASKADVVLSTVYQIWNRYLEEGRNVEKAIEEKPRSGQPPKLTDEVKAHVTAIACSRPPEGRDQWSLRMISEKVVELVHVKISTEAIRQYLKKSSSSPGARSSGSSAK